MLDLNRLPDAIKHEGGVSRRLFLAYGAALAATPLLANRALAQVATDRPSFSSNPFTLGVASGDPDPQGMVLWTRLAPEPLHPNGGMGNDPIRVSWELAEDEGMSRVVKKGQAVASPDLAHSVHVEVDGLQPDRWYWYRFRAGDAETIVARTRTMPDPASMPEELRFAFASCQQYEAGYYTAYEHMAQQELDLVFHLGDYIYESGARDGKPRRHAGDQRLMTLEDYRIRYSQYHTDPHLQAAHARCPWFLTSDDHEVSNNYADDIDGGGKMDPAKFLKRRAAAYQAYYEALPLRALSLPKGPDMQLYRRGAFGRLAQMHILDTRQYRSDQPNGDGQKPLNDAAFDPSQTIMGSRQREWLQDGLVSSPGTWNVVAQQVMIAMISRRRPMPDDAGEHPPLYTMDSWCGYAQEREELMQFMQDRKVKNPVVLTGNVHANYVNDLRVDDRQADKPIVATEFVGTSITSAGDGTDKPADLDQVMADNPGLHFHNRLRGYVRCTVRPDSWQSDYFNVDQISKPHGNVSKRISFVVESGRPGAQEA